MPVPRAPFDLLVVTDSTGSFDVLRTLLAGLPATFPVPIAVVRHVSPHYPSYAAALFSRRCPLAIADVTTVVAPRPGTVYLAPPDQHLVVGPTGHLATERTTRVNFTRPAADPLFLSAARAHGPRILALVLSGHGQDGARGLVAVKAAGGTTIVQEPATCAAPAMPAAAIRSGAADFDSPARGAPRRARRAVHDPRRGAVFPRPQPPAPARLLTVTYAKSARTVPALVDRLGGGWRRGVRARIGQVSEDDRGARTIG